MGEKKQIREENVLPTTKSCPLIKPAETSSCATPSAVSGDVQDRSERETRENYPVT